MGAKPVRAKDEKKNIEELLDEAMLEMVQSALDLVRTRLLGCSMVIHDERRGCDGGPDDILGCAKAELEDISSELDASFEEVDAAGDLLRRIRKSRRTAK